LVESQWCLVCEDIAFDQGQIHCHWNERKKERIVLSTTVFALTHQPELGEACDK